MSRSKRNQRTMPLKLLHPCNKSDCGVLVRTPYCPAHGKQRTNHGKSAANRARMPMYWSWWRRVRLVFLAQHPLCVACLDIGKTTEAEVVDHIIPHRGDKALFRDPDNWQSLCVPCHNRKTMTHG